MPCEPAVSVEVVRTASSTPLTTLSGTVVVVALPSMSKTTLPVGVPVPDWGATTAVNVTDWPTVEGLTVEVSVAAVGERALVVGVVKLRIAP